MQTVRRFRRLEAIAFLRERGFQCSLSSMEKFARNGDGPPMEYWGRFPTYLESELMSWAQARLGKPVRSTAERHSLAA